MADKKTEPSGSVFFFIIADIFLSFWNAIVLA